MKNYDIVVIGGGPGGYVAAIRAAQLQMKVALIEKEHLGGICLNWGCIPTKALLKSAQVFNYISHAAEYGITLGSEAKADMGAIVQRSRQVSENMSKGVAFLMQKNKIDVIEGFGKVKVGKKVDVQSADGSIEEISAQHIILATGARSKELPNLPQDGKKIIGYREAMTLPYLPKSMIIVGSGAIGSEFAHFYSSLGTAVNLVEFLPSILPNEDADTSSAVQRAFKKRGVKIFTSTSVERVEQEGDLCKAYIQGKKGESVLEAEIVLSAVGVTPNTENIGLEETGILVEKGKIVVDDNYQTNREGYFAIGDVVKGPALAHVASREAIVCVEHIAGLSSHAVDYANIPGCTYSSPEVASVGLTEAAAIESGAEIKVGKFMFMASGKAAASGNRDGFVKVLFDAKTGKLLGCHMVGDNVTEMIAEAVLVREKGLTAEDILSAVHPHPTMSEAFMEATEAAYGKAIHG